MKRRKCQTRPVAKTPLLRGQFTDLQPGRLLGEGEKCRFSGFTGGLLYQSPCFNKTPQGVRTHLTVGVRRPAPPSPNSPCG